MAFFGEVSLPSVGIQLLLLLISMLREQIRKSQWQAKCVTSKERKFISIILQYLLFLHLKTPSICSPFIMVCDWLDNSFFLFPISFYALKWLVGLYLVSWNMCVIIFIHVYLLEILLKVYLWMLRRLVQIFLKIIFSCSQLFCHLIFKSFNCLQDYGWLGYFYSHHFWPFLFSKTSIVCKTMVN